MGRGTKRQDSHPLSPVKRQSLGPHGAAPRAPCGSRSSGLLSLGVPPVAPRRQLRSPPPGCPPASRPLELAGRSRPRDRGAAALKGSRLLTQHCGSERKTLAPPTLGTLPQARPLGVGEGTCAGRRRASGPQPPPQWSTSGGCELVAHRRPQHPPTGLKLRPPEPIRAREQPRAGPALSPRPAPALTYVPQPSAEPFCRYSAALALWTFLTRSRFPANDVCMERG